MTIWNSFVLCYLANPWKAMKTALVLTILALWLPVYSQPASFAEPDRRAIPMLVGLNQRQRWMGTGVVIAGGSILTARHTAATKMHVYLPSAVVEGQVACSERNADLAVVASDSLPSGPSYFVALTLPVVGERVAIGGYPGGQWTVTDAVIAGYAPAGRIGGVTFSSPIVKLHPRNTLGPGASGSPMIDRRGRVVAVLAGGSGNENTAFALGTALQDCRRLLPKESFKP